MHAYDAKNYENVVKLRTIIRFVWEYQLWGPRVWDEFGLKTLRKIVYMVPQVFNAEVSDQAIFC